MKKLPKVFQNELKKTIKNNKEVCILKNEEPKLEQIKIEEQEESPNNTQNITEILNEVFNGIGYSYNIQLEIKTNEKTYNTSLIAKTNNNLITIDNEIIPISSIICIKYKKNSK